MQGNQLMPGGKNILRRRPGLRAPHILGRQGTLNHLNLLGISGFIKRGKQPRPFPLGDDRAVRPLAQAPRRGIAVDADDEGIAFGAGCLEQGDVPGMEQIKNAVGENDPALSGAPGGGGLGRTDLRGRVQSGCEALGWKLKL